MEFTVLSSVWTQCVVIGEAPPSFRPIDLSKFEPNEYENGNILLRKITAKPTFKFKIPGRGTEHVAPNRIEYVAMGMDENWYYVSSLLCASQLDKIRLMKTRYRDVPDGVWFRRSVTETDVFNRMDEDTPYMCDTVWIGYGTVEYKGASSSHRRRTKKKKSTDTFAMESERGSRPPSIADGSRPPSVSPAIGGSRPPSAAAVEEPVISGMLSTTSSDAAAAACATDQTAAPSRTSAPTGGVSTPIDSPVLEDTPADRSESAAASAVASVPADDTDDSGDDMTALMRMMLASSPAAVAKMMLASPEKMIDILLANPDMLNMAMEKPETKKVMTTNPHIMTKIMMMNPKAMIKMMSDD
jgi:hypothetical protein